MENTRDLFSVEKNTFKSKLTATTWMTFYKPFQQFFSADATEAPSSTDYDQAYENLLEAFSATLVNPEYYEDNENMRMPRWKMVKAIGMQMNAMRSYSSVFSYLRGQFMSYNSKIEGEDAFDSDSIYDSPCFDDMKLEAADKAMTYIQLGNLIARHEYNSKA